MEREAPEPFAPHPNLSNEINRHIQQSEIEGGAWLEKLAVGRALAIQTQNARYLLRKTGEKAYTLEGHAKYCPTPTVAHPHGSTWGGSMLKIGFVGRGMYFECGLDGVGTITTTAVEEVEEVSC